MLEALIITLREGVEAALVIGIIYAFLRKEGLDREVSAVWAGLAAAVAGSLAGAWMLHSITINEEAFEGVLYVSSALVVSTMVVWMWRHARHVEGQIKGTLGRIAARGSSPAVWSGVFLFTFLMVFREGVETALFLAAVSLTTSGVLTALGATAGIGLAAAFGVAFTRGSVRMDLGRFFKVTGIALFIFTVQLLFNGYHELSEAGWLPASPETMAVIGPLVRYELFFIVAVLALPLLAVAIPGRSARAERPGNRAPVPDANPAEQRLRRLETRRQGRARVAVGTLGVVILALLGLGFTYSATSAETAIELVEPGADGAVRIPLDSLVQGELHRYGVALDDGREVRFIAMRVGDDEIVTGLDACVICGAQGYSQEGSEVLCLHCMSPIHPPTIGTPGGCNPIPLEFRTEGGELIVEAGTLDAVAPVFAGDGAEHHAG